MKNQQDVRAFADQKIASLLGAIDGAVAHERAVSFAPSTEGPFADLTSMLACVALGNVFQSVVGALWIASQKGDRILRGERLAGFRSVLQRLVNQPDLTRDEVDEMIDAFPSLGLDPDIHALDLLAAIEPEPPIDPAVARRARWAAEEAEQRRAAGPSIVLCGEDIRDILAGRKTQLRIPLDPQPPSDEQAERDGCQRFFLCPRVSHTIRVYSQNDYDKLPKQPGAFEVTGSVGYVRDKCGQTQWDCPLGPPGTRLWVQEEWGPAWHHAQPPCFYRATEADVADCMDFDGWQKAETMHPRNTRIWITPTDERVERLKAITGADAVLEGIAPSARNDADAVTRYLERWEKRHGIGSVAANPLVFVVTFAAEFKAKGR